MKLTLNFGSGVIALPEKILDVLKNMSELETKLFIIVSEKCALREDFLPEDASEMLGVSKEDVENALKYLIRTGLVLSSERMASVSVRAKQTENTPVTVVKSGDEAPTYTGAEIEKIFENTPSCRSLVDSCQRIFEKMFTLIEINKVISLKDYYRLDEKYIETLFNYCKEIGKANVPYAYKTALAFYSDGIITYDALENKLTELKKLSSLEAFVRKLLGFGERKLIAKETKFVEMWSEADHPRELIELAYEIAVGNTGEPSMPYMNKTLINWQEAGHTTLDAVVSSIDKYRQTKKSTENPLSRLSGKESGNDSIEEKILSTSRARAQKKLAQNK